MATAGGDAGVHVPVHEMWRSVLPRDAETLHAPEAPRGAGGGGYASESAEKSLFHPTRRRGDVGRTRAPRGRLRSGLWVAEGLAGRDDGRHHRGLPAAPRSSLLRARPPLGQRPQTKKKPPVLRDPRPHERDPWRGKRENPTEDRREG